MGGYSSPAYAMTQNTFNQDMAALRAEILGL